MLDPEVVVRIRLLQQLGWGAKRIAREVGVARNSVRRYLRQGVAAETQERPGARRLDEATVIVDELGYLPLEKQTSHLFFQLVSRRYERGSLLLTTNQTIIQWGTSSATR